MEEMLLVATNGIAAIVIAAVGYYDLTRRVVGFRKKRGK